MEEYQFRLRFRDWAQTERGIKRVKYDFFPPVHEHSYSTVYQFVKKFGEWFRHCYGDKNPRFRHLEPKIEELGPYIEMMDEQRKWVLAPILVQLSLFT